MLERHERPDGAVVYRSPILERVGVPHAFTTRLGGACGELDVGPLLSALKDRLRAAVGVPATVEPFDVRQVHGSEVLEADAAVESGARAADGLVTERADRLVLVRTADCVPILLARSDGLRVAAVHAGWRGLLAGVIESTLERLGPGEHVAAVGPCICADCFEVGSEVSRAFEDAHLSEVLRTRTGVRDHVDLRAAAALQLERAGVRRVESSDRCTYEHGDEFYSHRRDVTHGTRPSTGRLASAIAPRSG